MAFTRDFIRKTAKDCGVEIPKEMEDTLVQEHLSARDAYAETQVKKYQDEHPPETAPNVKETEEYKALKKSFDDYKADQAAKETKAAKESAYREVLKAAGIPEKRLAAVLRVSDLSGVELDSDGKIKDADKLADNIKTEWADFIPTTRTTGTNPANPPANNPSKAEPTSLAEALRQKYSEKG